MYPYTTVLLSRFSSCILIHETPQGLNILAMLAILTMETIVAMVLKATKVFVMGSCQRLVRSTNEEGWRDDVA